MDLYGLLFLEIQIWNLWIILSQLLIGIILLSCYTIYQSVFTIISYSQFFLSCQKVVKLKSILVHFLASQFCITLISINLVRFYDYSSLDLSYQILRAYQYFFTYLILQQYGEAKTLQLHYILDTLMNILGILYLNYESIFFWFIIGQIALGCFHYCLFIMSLLIFTFSNYYLSICKYIKFRLNKMVENNDLAGYMQNFIRLYLLTQLALDIQIITEQYLQAQNIWPELIRLEITYFILRIIQYSFHLLIQYQNIDVFECQFTFYFLMDIFGFCILLQSGNYFWKILFQIILGFIIYYLLLIESISIHLDQRYQYFETLFNTFVIFLMLEIIFSIIGIKYNLEEIKDYLIFRVIQYGIILLFIKHINLIDNYYNFGFCFVIFQLITFTTMAFYLLIKMFLLPQKQIFVNLLLFTQLFVDLIIFGRILYYILYKLFDQQDSQDEHINGQEPQKIYIMTEILWWLQEGNIEIIDADVKCSICQVKLKNGSETCKLECHPTHEFHSNCLQGWEIYKSTCPLCRQQIKKQIQVSVHN